MMKPTKFLIRTGANLHAPPNPAGRLVHSNRPPQRRLEDHLASVFYRACASNDTEGAADVLAVLEKWHAKRLAKNERARRNDSEIKAMRAELGRITALGISRLTR